MPSKKKQQRRNDYLTKCRLEQAAQDQSELESQLFCIAYTNQVCHCNACWLASNFDEYSFLDDNESPDPGVIFQTIEIEPEEEKHQFALPILLPLKGQQTLSTVLSTPSPISSPSPTYSPIIIEDPVVHTPPVSSSPPPIPISSSFAKILIDDIITLFQALNVDSYQFLDMVRRTDLIHNVVQLAMDEFRSNNTHPRDVERSIELLLRQEMSHSESLYN